MHERCRGSGSAARRGAIAHDADLAVNHAQARRCWPRDPRGHRGMAEAVAFRRKTGENAESATLKSLSEIHFGNERRR